MKYSHFINNEIRDPVTAAVGENGHPTIDYYAEGYFESVRFIIREILTRLNLRKNPNWNEVDIKYKNITEDILVYPICFNIRHSIELYLKAIIQKIISIYRIKNLTTPTLLNINHHDILLLWSLINSHSFFKWEQDSEIDRKQIFDEDFDVYLDELDDYIDQWGNIDRTGQTFRYPSDTESRRHLAEISNIQILFLFDNAEKNHKKLEEFYYFICTLHDYYKIKRGNQFLTYTQLEKLAKLLPPFEQWGERLTNELKNDLKEEFKLCSQKQLSKCIDYIKEDYYLSSIISRDIPFKILSYDKIKNFIKYFEAQKQRNFVKGDHSESEDCLGLNLKKLEEWAQERESIKSFFSNYTYDELIDLITIIYMGRSKILPQEYQCWHDYMMKTFKDSDAIINKIQEKQINIIGYLQNSLKVFGKSFLFENID
ncbi:hypothetical protein [Neisseria sp.]|uniref:hypothetical protein n=1 Tax=Neisseria sp. TaxID=192066 RepID=UPI0026DCE40F|nr:hypothetical protein [Neisseria sp.]MDO4227978.1 hypothetical protein [Neisseria sp.]